MNVSKTITPLYRRSLLLAAAWLLFQPIFSVNTFAEPDLQDEESNQDKVQRLISPHFKEYIKYQPALLRWTDYNYKDRFIRKKLQELQDQIAQTPNFLDQYYLSQKLNTKLKEDAETCSINIFRKNYNGALSKDFKGNDKMYYVAGRLEESRAIFMKNYETYGNEFTLHFPEDSASMGFSSTVKEDLTSPEKMLESSVEDLMILKGERGVGQEQSAFCYNNALTSESPMLGATEAIKNMTLRATTDVEALKKRAATIQHFVHLLEDPTQADLLEENLQKIMKFEDDFLQVINKEEIKRSVLGQHKNYFFAAGELVGINRIVQHSKIIADNFNSSPSTTMSERGALDHLAQGIGKIGKTVNWFSNKLKRIVDENEILLMLGIPFTLLTYIANKGKLAANAYDTLFGKGESYGFNILNMMSDLRNGQYASLAHSTKKACYTIFLKDYKDNLATLAACLPGNQKKSKGFKETMATWAKGIWTWNNIYPVELINYTILKPLDNAANNTYGVINAVAELGANIDYLPSKKMHELKESLTTITTNPRECLITTAKLLKEGLPNTFTYSYEKLIGISKFFEAASDLYSQFDVQRKAHPEIAESLKLLNYLEEFSGWMNNFDTSYKTPLDRNHEEVVAKIEQRIEELQAVIEKEEEINFFSEKLDILRSEKDEFQNMLTKYNDKIGISNGDAVARLLKLLQTQLFKEKPEFFKQNQGLFQTHVGKVTVTFKRMVDLHEHFYPMYHALSELVAMIALAKKIVKSKKDTYKKYCIVNFETSSTQPHFKVKNGWNPTAKLRPADGFSHIIPASFELGGRNDGKEQHMLLTGSNGKGKSTLMRASAYQIWTAQTLGIAPAETLSLTPFHFLYSLKKNVEAPGEGESTHMKQVEIVFHQLADTIDTLSQQKKFSWINCDEMFNGTAPGSAVANTVTFLKHLPIQCTCCVATHYNEVPIIAPHETGGQVICYKINKADNILEKGFINMTAESTNTNIMEKKGINANKVKDVKRIELELASITAKAMSELLRRNNILAKL